MSVPGRYRRRPRRGWLLVLLLVLWALWRYRNPAPVADQPPQADRSAPAEQEPASDSSLAATLPEGEYRVARVFDGDTFALDNGVHVRLIAVNCPETGGPYRDPQPLGQEAKAFAEEFLQGGRVRLAFDKERVDKYGRAVAYVWVGERMLNAELLRAGLAWPLFHFATDKSLIAQMQAALDYAKAERSGVWADDDS